jgi:23S rRNA (uracil1939-C5)-methyltransferase
MARLLDGRVGFVSGGLPGDVVLPTDVLSKKGYVRADTWSMVRPSEHRIPPPCPIAERCGGCDWMALERGAQLAHKAAILREALARTGRFVDLPTPEIITAGPELGYRARVRFHVDSDGAVGFFAKRSHELVEVHRCPVCRPEIDRALSLLRTLARAVLREFSSAEIRSTLQGGVVMQLEPRPGHVVSSAARRALADLSGDANVSIAGEPTQGGSGQQVVSLLGRIRVGAGPGVFTQVNPDVNAVLVAEIVEGAKARSVARFCDLFAGVGNFALPLLVAGMTGVAVERDARAVESGRRAAKEAGLSTDTFVADDAGRFLEGLPRDSKPFDLVILDPPRRGARDVLDLVARAAPRHIAMCSCDPVTLARDLATLARSGYELRSVRGFDMFPQTHHLEALAWMERRST